MILSGLINKDLPAPWFSNLPLSFPQAYPAGMCLCKTGCSREGCWRCLGTHPSPKHHKPLGALVPRAAGDFNNPGALKDTRPCCLFVPFEVASIHVLYNVGVISVEKARRNLSICCPTVEICQRQPIDFERFCFNMLRPSHPSSSDRFLFLTSSEFSWRSG